MKVVKTQVILHMYDVLKEGKELKSKDVVDTFGISKRTYFNYVSEIKSYLANFYLGKILIYDYSKNQYRLI